MITVTEFIIACGSTLVVTFLFLYQFIIPSGANPNIVWVVLGISIVLGLVFGYFMTRLEVLFFIALGALLGYVLGEVVYNLGFNRIQTSNPAVRIISIYNIRSSIGLLL